MEWFSFALGFTSAGFLLSSLAVFYIMGDDKNKDDLDDMELRGPFATMDEVLADIKKMEKKETKDAKGKKSTTVSEIKPKS